MRIRPGDLPAFAASALGFVPDEASVVALISDGRDLVAARLSDTLDVDALTERAAMGGPAVVHLVGYGESAITLLQQWQRAIDLHQAIQQRPLLRVGATISAIDAHSSIELADPEGPVYQISANPNVLSELTAGTRSEAITRLTQCLPEETIDQAQIHAATTHITTAHWSTTTKTSIVIGALEQLRNLDTAPPRVTIGDVDIETRALAVTLLADSTVAAQVTKHITSHPSLIPPVTMLARTSPLPAALAVLEVAARAAHTTGQGEFGPISTGTIAQWIKPAIRYSPSLNSVYQHCTAGIDGLAAARQHNTVNTLTHRPAPEHTQRPTTGPDR
ncbi:hypothetical protein SAMN06309944_0726 [Micrococcales bacterium KH10]|nr:hypothetical protein SAMN06309944_0726 [Micrococcales bacterium KH10]